MKRAMIVMAAALFATACQPMPDPVVDTTDVPPAVRTPMDLSPTECAAQGGTMRPVGRAQTSRCVISYSDAGKRCTTGSDCQGDCRAETAPFPVAGATAVGTCQRDSQPFGCHATIENGRAGPAICID